MAKKYDVENKDFNFFGVKGKYTGEYSAKHYEADGYGKVVLENGDSFKGKFSKGAPYIGRYTYENGSYVDIYYEVQWFTRRTRFYVHYDAGKFGYKSTHEDRPNKKETYSNGYYVGEFKNGKKDGIGTYYWNDGDKYTGGWKDGKIHGIGKYTYANGHEYWFLHENGVEKHTLDEPDFSSQTTSPYTPSYDDYEPSYSSYDDDDNDGPTQSAQDAYERAIDAYNRGDYEGAARDLSFLNNNGYVNDFTVTDELGHEQNMKEFADEVNDKLNEDDDDEYSDE